MESGWQVKKRSMMERIIKNKNNNNNNNNHKNNYYNNHKNNKNNEVLFTLWGQGDRGLVHCRSPCTRLQLCSWSLHSLSPGCAQTGRHKVLEWHRAVPPSPSLSTTSLNLHMNLWSLTNNLNKHVSVNPIMAVSYCGQLDVSVRPNYLTTKLRRPSPVAVNTAQDKWWTASSDEGRCGQPQTEWVTDLFLNGSLLLPFVLRCIFDGAY